MEDSIVQQATPEEGITKMLGAHVPEEIYWKFKTVASNRKETMGDAILNAALLYMSVEDAGESK